MRYYIQFSVLILFLTACASNTQAPKEVEKDIPKDVPKEVTIIEVQDTFATNTVSDTAIEPKLEATKLSFDYDTTKWTDVGLVESSIVLDLKYATTDNFVDTKMYDCARCFLRPVVADRILDIHHALQEKGYGLKMFDCYRPRPIQWKLWEKVPDPRYVADPRKGSMHNRGGAVDLTIVDRKGNELDMGTAFDFFGKEAYHDYTEHSDKINANRKLLKESMEQFGFKAIRTEWWHYSYRAKQYALDDMVWNCK